MRIKYWKNEDGDEMLWVCPSCDAHLNSDCIGYQCPACENEIEETP
jgi:tRNA(Ile2) C34 agmatinyltransferase TiaS